MPCRKKPGHTVFTGATENFRHEAIRKIALPGSTILALLLAIGVYHLDRDRASALFLAPFAAYQPGTGRLFGSLGEVLPSFLHAYAFSLLLILALGRTRYARQIGALAWFAVAAGLEILQAEHFHQLTSGPPLQPAASTMISSIQTYVVNGHFDWNDLAAPGLGCLAAFAIASVPEKTK
jgi:hypothetical protein